MIETFELNLEVLTIDPSTTCFELASQVKGQIQVHMTREEFYELITHPLVVDSYNTTGWRIGTYNSYVCHGIQFVDNYDMTKIRFTSVENVLPENVKFIIAGKRQQCLS